MKTNDDVLQTAKLTTSLVNYFKREIKSLEARLNERVESGNIQFASKSELQEFKQELIEECNKSIQPLKENAEGFRLPDDIIYKFHLNESVTDINRAINEARTTLNKTIDVVVDSIGLNEENTKNKFEQVDKALEEIDQAAADGIGDLKGILDSHDHDATYVSIDEHTSNVKSITESVQSLSEEVSATTGDIRESLSKTTHVLSETISSVNDLLEAEAKSIRDSLDETKKGLQDSDKVLKEQIDHTLREISRARTDFSGMLDSARNEIEESLATKSDINHTHDAYALVNHDHMEFQKIFRDMASVRTKSDADFKALDSSLNQVLRELTTKASKNEVLAEKDVNVLINNAKAAILKDIPTPKDGVDAHEWQFRPHYRQYGYLEYKRDDWKEWKNIDLLGSLRSKIQELYDRSYELEKYVGAGINLPVDRGFGGGTSLIEGDLIFRGELAVADYTNTLPEYTKAGSQYVIIESGTLAFTEPMTYVTTNTVEVGDMLIFTAEDRVVVIQRNDEQATETTLGNVRLATQDETNQGTNDTAAVTPLKLEGKLIEQQYVRGYFTTISTTAAVPVVITHNLNLFDRDAFTINIMHNNSQVGMDVESIDANSIKVTTLLSLTDAKVTIHGFTN